MRRGREGRGDFIHSSSPFDNFGVFGSHRSMMPRIFGGTDPFDDPFFTRPFGSSMFSSDISSRNSHSLSESKGPVIEELVSDDEMDEEDGDINDTSMRKDRAQNGTGAMKNPLVEHPDDEVDERMSKDVTCRADRDTRVGTQSLNRNVNSRSVSFRRVTYGGINGAYYTATTTRRTGNDGVVLEESKQADRTTGQATHRVSLGIHDKGHSLMRKLNSDGKVDTMQTLHNLNEDELPGFEQAWKGNADRHLPGWDNGFELHENAGARNSGQSPQSPWSGCALPFAERLGRVGGSGHDNKARAHANGRPKKVVTINID